MLSVSRKDDRSQMAATLAALASKHGADATVEPMGERELWVNIRADRGVRLTVDFDGDDGQQRSGVHVLSWHMAHDSDARLSGAFAPSVNNCHWRKATDIAEGFEQLCAIVAARLDAVRDGSAFQPEGSQRRAFAA